MIEDIIYILLSSDSTITDMVSTRIYPQLRDQNDGLPALTYQMIIQNYSHDINGNNGLCEATVQINCYASTVLGSIQLADVVRSSLGSYQGGKIESIILESMYDLPTINVENELMNVFAKIMDFYVLYKE
jgi:hypothetical protein